MTHFRRWFIAAAAPILSAGLAGAQTPYLISTYAGGLPGPTSAVATSYSFQNPNGLATDPFGNLYLSATFNCVFRLDPKGNLSRVAGTCEGGYSGDGGSAVNAQLNNPQGVAVDAAGNLYIADTGNNVIRKVAANGAITTMAGTGTAGYLGDNGPATSAQLNSPWGIAVDAAGNLYIADQQNDIIRKVAGNGIITTFAGTPNTPGRSGDGGPATNATLNYPSSVALDAAGNLYIGDGSYQVRRVDFSGTITHVAGTGVRGYSGDSGPAASAKLSTPAGLALDSQGNLYIADRDNNVIRKVDSSGTITTYAGGGSSLGDGPATNAQLSAPLGIAVDYNYNLYIAVQSYWVRVVNAGGIITTAAGNGLLPFSGDGGPAALAQFTSDWGLASDGTNLYVADWRNSRVRKITPAGTISTFAGNGIYGDAGDGGPATSASITSLVVATDSLGNVYLADVAVVRKVDTNGIISTVAGLGFSGFSGDGGPAIQATLRSYLPGLAVDSNQNLYIADYDNSRVRKVTSSGTISTVAGTGVPGYSGDNGPGTSAQLSYPASLAVDANGNLYIADGCRIRVLAVGGLISTVAGNGTCNNTGDGTSALNAGISYPSGVAVDSAGNLYISTLGNTIRKVAGGIITTIAGTGVAGFSGDGGPAAAAQLNFPLGLAAGFAGNIYVGDFSNNAVRVLQPAGTEPVLAVSSASSGIFTAGQTDAAYTVTVSNATGAAPTTGTVTVTDIVPAGLSLVSMSGSGWSCSGTVCTNSTTLGGGSSFEPISVLVNVPSGAVPQVTNQVTVSGGGALAAGSADVTFVGPSTPVLAVAATHVGNFAFGEQNATYTIAVGNQSAAAATSSTVTVTDNLPPGLTLVSMDGTGWTCAGSACMRSDPLGAGASYNPITVTVQVATNAASPVTNQVTVSGGGSLSASATDVTTIVALPCSITGDAVVSVVDVQAEINQSLGTSSSGYDLNQDGVVNVVDIQIVMNAALGLGCVP